MFKEKIAKQVAQEIIDAQKKREQEYQIELEKRLLKWEEQVRERVRDIIKEELKKQM